MKTRKRRQMSDIDNPHSYTIEGPMEIGDMPYDEWFDLGPNGKWYILNKLRFDQDALYPGFTPFEIYDFKEVSSI